MHTSRHQSGPGAAAVCLGFPSLGLYASQMCPQKLNGSVKVSCLKVFSF